MPHVFEQPWTLLTAAIVVLFVTLIVRIFLPDKRHWWQWLLSVFLVVAAFGLDYLVQTDTEKINAVITTMVKAVEEENPNAIERILAESYRDSYHNSKVALTAHCRVRLSEPLVDKNIKRIVSIEISSSNATAIFTVRIVFDKRSSVYQNFKQIMFIKMKLNLQKQQGQNWLINRAEILEIDRQPATWQHIRF